MDKYTTTLGAIKAHHPCRSGWYTLTDALQTENSTKEVSLAFILKSNGVRDAVWALRCFPYESVCLFSADVAESVYKLTKDKTGVIWAAIQAVHYFHAGIVDEVYLRKAYAAAYAAAAADAADAYAAYAAACTNKWVEIEQLFIKHFCQED